mgnify:FL=1
MKRWKVLRISIILVAALACLNGPGVCGEDGAESVYHNITEWLVLGPLPTPPPAFDMEDKETGGLLLSYPLLPRQTEEPKKGSKIYFPAAGEYQWEHRSSDTGELVLSEEPEKISAALLASYIELDRWAEVDFRVSCQYPFILEVGGEKVIDCGKGKSSGEYEEGSVKLKRGKHRIAIKTVCVPGDSIYSWKLVAGASTGDETGTVATTSVSPERGINIHDILDPPHIRDIELSGDGKLAAVTISRIISEEGNRETETRIIKTGSGESIRTIIHEGGIGRIKWAGGKNQLSYTVTEDNRSTIRIMDLDSGTDKVIARDLDRLEYYSWSRDGKFIIYSANCYPHVPINPPQILRYLYYPKS